MATSISAVILAGGQGRRMGGVDKGLQLFQNQPLFMHAYQRLRSQIAQISISANRNQSLYAQSGLAVFADHLADFQGPLSGMLTALERAESDFVLFVPCDCPFLPENLLETFKSAVDFSKNLIAYADDGERSHPTFCVISTALKVPLTNYLAQGERKILHFFQQQQGIKVDFSAQKFCFRNINTLMDLMVEKGS